MRELDARFDVKITRYKVFLAYTCKCKFLLFQMNYPCKESFRKDGGKFPYEIETNNEKEKDEKEKNARKITTRRYNERACIAGSLAKRSYLEIDPKSLT